MPLHYIKETGWRISHWTVTSVVTSHTITQTWEVETVLFLRLNFVISIEIVFPCYQKNKSPIIVKCTTRLKKKQHFFLIYDTLKIDKLIKSIFVWKLFVYSFICHQAQLCSSNRLGAMLNWVKLCKNQVCKTLYNSTFCWFFIFFHNSISAHCSASASSANSLIGRSTHIFMKKS